MKKLIELIFGKRKKVIKCFPTQGYTVYPQERLNFNDWSNYIYNENNRRR